MSSWTNSARRLARDSGGAEVAEFAAVLPIVMMLLLAIVFFGRAYNVYSTITYAAREGAKVYVQQGCATCGTTAPAASDVAARVRQVLQASHIDPSRVQLYAPSPAPTKCGGGALSPIPASGINVYSNAQLNAVASSPPACGVVVSFQYPFTFFSLPFTSLNHQTIHLTAAVQMQGEN